MSDSISREQAIDIVEKYDFDFPQYMERFVTELRDAMKTDIIHDLKHLPSADRPTGEWVRKYDKQINCYWYECNQCGEYRPRNVFGKEWSSPYCPNCGARMEGGEEE